MDAYELIALLVTAVGVVSFGTLFTVLYRSYANSAVTEYESGVCDVELIEETIAENFKNSKRIRRVMKRLKQVFVGLVILLLIPFLFLSVYTRFTGGMTMIGGRGIMAVASPSMSEKNLANPYLNEHHLDNQFNQYDMIVVEKVDSPDDLQLYDVIVYVNNEGTNIIHRIVDIKQASDGIRYLTRGDKNNASDTYMPCMDDILGKYTDVRVPYVGMFIVFLQSFSGILTLASIIYCLIMIETLGNRIYTAREDRLEILLGSIDIKTETVQDDHLDAIFIETVYFKDYAYTFDDNGFVSKTLISESAKTQDLISEPKAEAPLSDSSEGNGDGEEL